MKMIAMHVCEDPRDERFHAWPFYAHEAFVCACAQEWSYAVAPEEVCATLRELAAFARADAVAAEGILTLA